MLMLIISTAARLQWRCRGGAGAGCARGLRRTSRAAAGELCSGMAARPMWTSAEGADAVRNMRGRSSPDSTTGDGISNMAATEPGTLGTAQTRRIGDGGDALHRHTTQSIPVIDQALHQCPQFQSVCQTSGGFRRAA